MFSNRFPLLQLSMMSNHPSVCLSLFFWPSILHFLKKKILQPTWTLSSSVKSRYFISFAKLFCTHGPFLSTPLFISLPSTNKLLCFFLQFQPIPFLHVHIHGGVQEIISLPPSPHKLSCTTLGSTNFVIINLFHLFLPSGVVIFIL